MNLVRTTLRLEEDVIKEAKRQALEADRTLQDVVNEALREKLKIRKVGQKRKRIKIRTYDMGEIKGTLRREEIYDWL